MSLFELSVLLKALPRPEVTSALKRVGTVLLDQGTIIHKIENLGLNDLPYRITQEGKAFTKGHHFVFHFLGAPKSFKDIKGVCSRDLDLLRCGIAQTTRDLNKKCTLNEELLPPPYRPSVHKLMDSGRRYKKITKRHYKHERDYSFFDIYM